MKLIHIVDLKGIGGVERLFCDFINYSIHSAKHITIANNGLHPLLYKDVTNSSEHVFLLKKYIGNFKIPKYFRSIKEKYIISKIKRLNSDLWLFWSIFPTHSLLSNILNNKSIYYEHGMAWYKRKFTSKNKYYLEKVNGIICISNASKRILQLKWGIKNDNIHICKNALRPTCKPVKAYIKALDERNSINLGIAGRCESFKGFPLVIHAVKELNKRGIPCNLYIAGIGKQFDELKKIVNLLSLENYVIFLGLVNDMKGFYSKIDIFVCPSLREPFGLVVVEAMAYGCPVIVAGVDGLPETLQGSNSGIIIKPTIDINDYSKYGGSLDFLNEIDCVYDPYTDTIITPKFIDPIYISDAIEKFWTEPDKFKEMSLNAIKIANDKYNYADYINNIYKIIENVSV
jgi:glycosyltransferase involved in cell wall biosynthesis